MEKNDLRKIEQKNAVKTNQNVSVDVNQLENGRVSPHEIGTSSELTICNGSHHCDNPIDCLDQNKNTIHSVSSVRSGTAISIGTSETDHENTEISFIKGENLNCVESTLCNGIKMKMTGMEKDFDSDVEQNGSDLNNINHICGDSVSSLNLHVPNQWVSRLSRSNLEFNGFRYLRNGGSFDGCTDRHPDLSESMSSCSDHLSCHHDSNEALADFPTQNSSQEVSCNSCDVIESCHCIMRNGRHDDIWSADGGDIDTSQQSEVEDISDILHNMCRHAEDDLVTSDERCIMTDAMNTYFDTHCTESREMQMADMACSHLSCCSCESKDCDGNSFKVEGSQNDLSQSSLTDVKCACDNENNAQMFCRSSDSLEDIGDFIDTDLPPRSHQLFFSSGDSSTRVSSETDSDVGSEVSVDENEKDADDYNRNYSINSDNNIVHNSSANNQFGKYFSNVTERPCTFSYRDTVESSLRDHSSSVQLGATASNYSDNSLQLIVDEGCFVSEEVKLPHQQSIDECSDTGEQICACENCCHSDNRKVVFGCKHSPQCSCGNSDLNFHTNTEENVYNQTQSSMQHCGCSLCKSSSSLCSVNDNSLKLGTNSQSSSIRVYLPVARICLQNKCNSKDLSHISNHEKQYNVDDSDNFQSAQRKRKHFNVPDLNFQNDIGHKCEKVFSKMAIKENSIGSPHQNQEEGGEALSNSQESSEDMDDYSENYSAIVEGLLFSEDVENSRAVYAASSSSVSTPHPSEQNTLNSNYEPIFEEILLDGDEEGVRQFREKCQNEARIKANHQVEKVMLWNEYEAFVLQVKQIGTSACGPTAMLNILKACDYLLEKSDICNSVNVNLRLENAQVPEYLFSRSVAGTTAHDLIKGIEEATNGFVRGRFFHFYPESTVNILKWLGFWMKKGAVPLATLNLQRGVKAGWTIPDAWHHQMIYGVSSRGIHVTNPLEIISEEVIMEQLSSPSVLLVRRQDVINRFKPTTDLGELLMHPDEQWRSMNVLGQVINVLREASIPQVHGMKVQITSHISIPAVYKSGVTLFMRTDSEAWNELCHAQDLPLKDQTASKER